MEYIAQSGSDIIVSLWKQETIVIVIVKLKFMLTVTSVNPGLLPPGVTLPTVIKEMNRPDESYMSFVFVNTVRVIKVIAGFCTSIYNLFCTSKSSWFYKHAVNTLFNLKEITL